MKFRRAVAVFVSLLLVGCSQSSPSSETAPAGETLTVLAGSELKDLEPLLGEIRDQTGVTLVLQYSGTLSGIDRINTGEHFDAAWFSVGSYLVMSDTAHRIKAQTKIMLSPVVIGVKESKAKELGWAGGGSVTWKDIAAAAAANRFRFAMTNPAASNSGFSALLGVASALAGTGDVVKPSDVDMQRLSGFFKGQQLTAGSSGWLIDAYVRDQGRLDGIVNYEANLISLNKSGRLTEPLVLIYPREGIVTADYPLILLDESKRADYDKVVSYLTSADFQRAVMTQTYRRPVNPDVALSGDFPKNLLVDLPLPHSINAVNGILLRYLNSNRVPSHSYFVLDTSGSMQGERLAALQHAIDTLAGGDPSLTGQFSKFADREKITFLTFSDAVSPPAQFEMHSATDVSTLNAIRKYGASLNADGNTAIFSAVEAAEDMAYKAAKTEGPRYYSIVLMTDGENNTGDDFDAFKNRFDALPPAERAVKVFPVIFGDASPDQLTMLADLTGGKVFDGSKDPLSIVFKEIRGYQ